MVAASLPVKQAELQPVSRSASNIPLAAGGFTGEIHVHLHGVDRQDAREIGRIAADAVSAAVNGSTVAASKTEIKGTQHYDDDIRDVRF